MPEDRDRWLVRPGTSVDLSAVDTRSTDGAPGDKHETKAASKALLGHLADLQARLHAESRRAVLLVVQAIDAGGKDGLVKKVFRGVNPQGVRVVSFKAPTSDELAHDFLWRVHAQVPRRGEIGVFNRSHYEDVLVTRVRGLVDARTCERRYAHIRAFESLLVDEGTTVVKVLLHISKEEQRERLQARLDEPRKRWKFDVGDLDERRRWDDYQAAFQDAVTATATAEAPWYCVPADRKWYRDWAVLRILTETLEAMAPRYPEPDPALDGLVVR